MITGLKIHTDTGANSPVNGAIHVVQVPEDCNTGDFLGDLVKQFHPGFARHSWTLRVDNSGAALPLDLTLAQNRIESNQELYLVPKAQDLSLEASAPDRKTMQFDVPSSTRTSTLLATLLGHLDLPKIDSNGKPHDWALVLERTGEFLDADRSLAANGVAGRDRLAIRPRPVQPIRFEVISPTGSLRQDEALPDTQASELLSGLVEYFGLPAEDEDGLSIQYALRLGESGKTLDPSKTLAENEVSQDAKLLLFALEKPDLVLEVGGPDGMTPQVTVPGKTLTEKLLFDQVAARSLEKRTKTGEARQVGAGRYEDRQCPRFSKDPDPKWRGFGRAADDSLRAARRNRGRAGFSRSRPRLRIFNFT